MKYLKEGDILVSPLSDDALVVHTLRVGGYSVINLGTNKAYFLDINTAGKEYTNIGTVTEETLDYLMDRIERER